MRKGFSMVELLVVIAILSLLMALIMPVLTNARGMAFRSTCLSNLRQTAIVFQSYATDFRGMLPLSNDTNPRLLRPDIHAAVEDYYPGPYKIFYCPSPWATTGPEWWDILRSWDANHYKIGYVYVGNLDVPGCTKFVNGDPIASIMDPRAVESPVLFDICERARSGAQNWREFSHDGPDEARGMNALFGDMHAEWRPLKELQLEYKYFMPYNLWW
jgi:prepilin-type N-terminal cleavage/methylation domain-containing protein